MHDNAQKTPWLRRAVLAMVTLLFAVPIVYVGMQVFLALHHTYRIETAIAYTMAESITLNGVAVFDSTPVPAAGLDAGYLVADGERVTAGSTLAEVYTDREQGLLRERLDRCERTIDLLTRSGSASGSDIAQLGTQSRQALYDLLDVLDSGSYAGAADAGDEFLLAQNRLQVRTGQSGGFEDAVAALEAEREGILDRLSGLETVTAGTNGYFVSATSAAGLDVDRTALDAMSAAELAEWLEAGVPKSQEKTAGQIVGGFTWWFYTVCTPQQAEQLTGLRSVQLSVPGKQDTPLDAAVLSLTADEDGTAKLVLQCESINAEVLRLGQENARIDLHTYEGIRVDRQALHIVDGERGVYVNYGGIQRFRRIETLYEDENYILVPPGGALGTDNEVRLYDEVIVEGSNLQDKKLL